MKTTAPPPHWIENTWEDKARENPLFAVMSAEQFVDADAKTFTAADLEAFFAHGRSIFAKRLAPLLTAPARLFEYGCGMGRIMKPAMEAGHQVDGADIAPTMLEHARSLLGDRAGLHLVDADGNVPVESGVFDLSYTNAVLQHIPSLAAYLKAVREIGRVTKQGGIVVLQLNCEDATTTPMGTTENFETYSTHQAPGRRDRRHDHTNWSGVYIGFGLLQSTLAEAGVAIERWEAPRPNKPRSIVVYGRKTA